MTGVQSNDVLTERVRALVGRRHHVVAAATVTPDEVCLARIGPARGADFEIGSISKGVTGLHYADALERGEITPTTKLGDLLPMAGAPAAPLTVRSLAVHRSGLPRLPASASPIKKTLSLWLNGTNPYGEDVDELVAQACLTKLRIPKARYSNHGFELLWHALAHASGMTYAEMVRRRAADPLGLTTFYVPAAPDDLRPSALVGSSRLGRSRQPWTGPFDGIGAWWTRDGQTEVDIAAHRDNRYTLLGSVKWKSTVDERALDQLEAARDQMGPRAARARLALFARHGFTDRLRERAERDDVALVTASDLF